MSNAEKLNKMREALEYIRDVEYAKDILCIEIVEDLQAKAFNTLYEIDNNIKDE